MTPPFKLSAVPSALPKSLTVLRNPQDSLSLRYRRRTVWLSVALGAFLLALICSSVLLGDYKVTISDVLAVLQGREVERRTYFFIAQYRLPRALVAALVGLALALAGAIFQGISRNPLASPDIVGVTHGASFGAAFVMLILGGGIVQASAGAAVGAIIMAALIVLLSRTSGLSGVRLVLVGIALGAVADAAVGYMLTQVFVSSAVTTQLWLVGTLQGRGWDELLPLSVVVLVVCVLVARYAPSLRLLALGDDTATALGVNTGRSRAILLALSTLLVAGAVATAGPISFVALAAPHISRRIAGSAALVPAALTGAVLLTISDLVAQHAFTHPIPVGVVTVTIGGAFFLWLLLREGRSRAA